MYKLHLHDPDEDVSDYQQKMIDQYLRDQRQNHHQPGQNQDFGDLEVVDPTVDPVDENLHLYDDLREMHNQLEADFLSDDDEMEFTIDNANSDALDSCALPRNSRRSEPAIYNCEKEEVDTCYDESRLILDDELQDDSVVNEYTEEEIDTFLSKDNFEYIKDIKSFDDLLNNSSSFDNINAELNVNRAELFMMLMKYASKYDVSHSGLSALISLINTMFKEPILPSSRYRLDHIFNSYNDVTYHATCPKCGEYLGNYKDLPNSSPCSSCLEIIDCSKPSLEHMFSIVDPSKAVSDIIHIHENYYDWVMKERVHVPGEITDIYDGYMYQRFRREQLPIEWRHSYATAILNSDGAAPYKFSKKTAWPIYIVVNEIPIQARLNNVIVCGLWFGKNKPDLNIFLKPLVDTLNNLSEAGIKTIIKGEERIIRLFTLTCSVDTMCRCSMQGTRQCNGRFGCSWCTHPGEYDKFSKSRKYGIVSRNVIDRDHRWVSRFMELAANDPEWIPLFGIKKPSPLLRLKHFDIVRGFVVDYMHCCLIGVTKKILTLLLGEAETEVLQNYMESIKLPTQVRRMTKPITDRSFWTAKDYENFLLYYSLPLLDLVCDKNYVSYWALFVESIHILVSRCISHEQLQKADRMLRQFVFETQTNFTLSSMVFNVHMLLHIVQSVYDWGPLVPISAFAFETANHYAMKAIKNAKGATLQIQRYLNNHHCIRVLEHTVLPRASEAVKILYETVFQSKIQHAAKMSHEITFLGLESSLEPTIAAHLELTLNCKCYRRMVKNGCLFTSDLENARSDNSVALLEQGVDKRYIQIQCFVIDRDQGYVLFKCLETEKHSLSDGLEQLRVVVGVNNNWEKASINEITTICASFEINHIKYVCSLPNLLCY